MNIQTYKQSGFKKQQYLKADISQKKAGLQPWSTSNRSSENYKMIKEKLVKQKYQNAVNCIRKKMIFVQLTINHQLVFIISYLMAFTNTKQAFVLLALISASIYISMIQFEQSPVSAFKEWKKKYNIKFELSFENAYRERIFLDNKQVVELHNKDPTRTYNRGINKFSALTDQEFKETYLTLVVEDNVNIASNNELEISDDLKAVAVDWRKLGAVSPVKNQGHCGSCWSFSAAGGLQGLNAIQNKKIESFSEQQLVDCVTGNSGCHGGQMRRALDYVRDNGIALQSDYPYLAVQGSCRIPKGNFKLSGYTNITTCNDLANSLTSQPIMVGVDSTNWRDYESGIFNNCPVDRGEFNHGVVVVGMTSDAWIVKNSWTSQWGQDGYMRLIKTNMCNVCNDGMFLRK